MEYRKLPRGEELISTLGLGMGGIQKCPEGEIQAIIELAIEHGVNFFDLCAGGKSVYEPFGRAIAGKRDKVYFQLHFGAVYKDNGEYGWSRDLRRIKDIFEWEMRALGTENGSHQEPVHTVLLGQTRGACGRSGSKKSERPQRAFKVPRVNRGGARLFGYR